MAIVPYGDDARRVDRARRTLRIQWRYLTQGINKAAVAIGRALTPVIQAVVNSFTMLYQSMIAAGLIPPLASTQVHGTRWTNPLTGEHLRVRGRRGRPYTFHWGP